MKKIQYEVDPHNRLVAGDAGKKSSLPKFRKVIDGRFRIDGNNDLSYRVKAPLSQDEKMPHQIKLKGEWSLTDDHRLRLTLDGQGRQTFGDRITLQGEILDVNKNSILFAVSTTKSDNVGSSYLLSLEGVWRADENNRLSFHVKREGGRYDILTFNGVWEIDNNHQIIYRYERARLIRKKKDIHTLSFKGHWDITDAVRISYILDNGTDSSFDFKTSVGIFRENYIRYELGIGLSGRPDPVRRTVTLSGRWNLKKGSGLVFELECEDGKTKRIIFGADARLTDRDTISFRLTNDMEEKDIGATLELSRRMLKNDGEAFLRFLRSSGESAVYVGAGWRW